jgi:Cu-Zn family superoxide dismutase
MMFVRGYVTLVFLVLCGSSGLAQTPSPDNARSQTLLETLMRSGTLPVEFQVAMYRTGTGGAGQFLGRISVKNTMIKIGGRDEPALLLKPNMIGLSPGSHAFHIHEYPDCGPKERNGIMVPGLAAGAHLFAEHVEGSEMVTYSSHLGTLPNVIVSPDGSATEAVIAPRLALADLVNRSLIVHASQDDNSGRFACGVLK